MKHLMMAAACAALFVSAPAFAQNSPDAGPTAAPSVAQPPVSVTPPTDCVAGQVLQANGQPCSPSSPTAQAPASPSLGAAPSSTAQAPSTLSPSAPPASTAQAPSTLAPSAPPASVATATGSTFIDRQGDRQYLASNLMGRSIVNAAGDKIGSVKDILFDDRGELAGFIMGVGGFLGIGEKSVAIAFDMVKPGKDANGNLILTASFDRDAVNSAPDFLTLEDQKARAPSNAPFIAPAPPR